MDGSLYHLDAVAALYSLDYILEISELNAIQWSVDYSLQSQGFEAGSPRWFPLYKKIREKGKLLHLTMPKEKVKHLVKELGPKGLLIDTRCASEEEARQLLEDVKIP